MNIAQILFSLIMVGLSTSLVFVNLELGNLRKTVSWFETKTYINEHDISKLADELKRLNELHNPQLETREQQERKLVDFVNRYLQGLPLE